MTQQEFDNEIYLDEYHEQALLECLELAAPFASNDCQDMHDEGEWLVYMRPAIGDFGWLTLGKDIACSEDIGGEGCSTTGKSPGLLALMMLGLGLLGRGQGRWRLTRDHRRGLPESSR